MNARWKNILSILNAIDLSFDGFMSLTLKYVHNQNMYEFFIERTGITDLNDISFQLKLIYELGLFGVGFQLFLFLLCLKEKLIFPWFIANFILLTADKFSEMWIIFIIFISLSKYCPPKIHIKRRQSIKNNFRIVYS